MTRTIAVMTITIIITIIIVIITIIITGQVLALGFVVHSQFRSWSLVLAVCIRSGHLDLQTVLSVRKCSEWPFLN